MHPDNFTSATKKAILAAGLPERTRLHDLRHAMGSVLRLEGVALDVVRDALGHHSVAFTTDSYGSVLPQRLGVVADAMEHHYGTPTG